MRKLIPAALAGAAVLLVAAPALPAVAAGTPAIIELSGGSLSISVLAVTVTDTRAADPASWTASVSATPFQDGSHSLGAETCETGVVSPTGIPISQFTITSPLTLSGSPQATVALNPTFSGDNTATWDPTITVAVPAGSVAEAYTAVITHSVI
jgi:hypothetical protein